MTPRQQAALDFIRQHYEAVGYSPSYREIAARLGMKSMGGVQALIDGLLATGKLQHDGSATRSLRPVEERTVKLSLGTFIAASGRAARESLSVSDYIANLVHADDAREART